MITAELTIKALSAGRILDVATGSGQFINFLKVVIDDLSDLNNDLKDPETAKFLSDATDQYLKRIDGLPGESTLRERGLELRKRVTEIGFHNATSLLVIGEKP